MNKCESPKSQLKYSSTTADTEAAADTDASDATADTDDALTADATADIEAAADTDAVGRELPVWPLVMILL